MDKPRLMSCTLELLWKLEAGIPEKTDIICEKEAIHASLRLNDEVKMQ